MRKGVGAKQGTEQGSCQPASLRRTATFPCPQITCVTPPSQTPGAYVITVAVDGVASAPSPVAFRYRYFQTSSEAPGLLLASLSAQGGPSQCMSRYATRPCTSAPSRPHRPFPSALLMQITPSEPARHHVGEPVRPAARQARFAAGSNRQRRLQKLRGRLHQLGHGWALLGTLRLQRSDVELVSTCAMQKAQGRYCQGAIWPRAYIAKGGLR